MPEPSTSPVAALLDKYTCCAVPNDQPFGLRTSSRSFVIRKHKAETGGCVEAICTIHTELSPLACAIKHLLGPCLAWCQTPHACTHSSCLCATLVTAVLHRRPYHRPRTRVLHTLGHSPPPRPAPARPPPPVACAVDEARDEATCSGQARRHDSRALSSLLSRLSRTCTVDSRRRPQTPYGTHCKSDTRG